MTLSASHTDFDPALSQSLALERNPYGLYTIDVYLGDHPHNAEAVLSAPLPFIVDTGANHTAIPLRLALELGNGDALNFNQVGQAMTGPFSTDLISVETLDFGFGSRTVELAVIDANADSELLAAGILGSNAFFQEKVILDFPASTLNRTPELHIPHWERDLYIHDGLIKGLGRVPGTETPVHVFIDTGATSSIVNSAMARFGRTVNRHGPINIHGVAGRLHRPVDTRRIFDGLELSQLCMEPFEVTVADVYAFQSLGWSDEPAIIIGMDVLQDTRIAIDHTNGEVRIDGVSERKCAS